MQWPAAAASLPGLGSTVPCRRGSTQPVFPTSQYSHDDGGHAHLKQTHSSLIHIVP